MCRSSSLYRTMRDLIQNQNHKSMSESLFGTFASWDIISEDIAIKHCDKSVFERLGSSVPKPTRWFWGIEQSPINTKKSIKFKYGVRDYVGTVNIYRNDLSQIYLDDDLLTDIDFLIIPGQYPDMEFKRIGENYYEITFLNTFEDPISCESIVAISSHNEGKTIQYYTTKYERSIANRNAAIKIHGSKCMVCGFDFEETYGELGKNFIEVHHVKPLSSINQEINVNPETDLVCLCSNCHRMIHRRRDSILTIEKLRSLISIK